jgi:aspartokinase
LNHRGIPAKLADTRELIITDSNFGDAQPLDAVSKRILSRYLMRRGYSGDGFYWFE